MQVMGAMDEYISIEISNAGTIRVAFDLGYERQEIYEESQYYANGQFHDVHVWRSNEGRTVNLQVNLWQRGLSWWIADCGSLSGTACESGRYDCFVLGRRLRNDITDISDRNKARCAAEQYKNDLHWS